MEIKTVKLRKRGQIVIPRDFREELQLNTGETLLMVRKGNELIMKKTKEIIKDIEKGHAIDPELLGFLRLTESSLAKDWSSKEDEIWDEY